MLAQSEAFMRQAESATVAARRLIAEKGESELNEQNATNENSDAMVRKFIPSFHCIKIKSTYDASICFRLRNSVIKSVSWKRNYHMQRKIKRLWSHK